jgi:hypothetical protein
MKSEEGRHDESATAREIVAGRECARHMFAHDSGMAAIPGTGLRHTHSAAMPES